MSVFGLNRSDYNVIREVSSFQRNIVPFFSMKENPQKCKDNTMQVDCWSYSGQQGKYQPSKK